MGGEEGYGEAGSAPQAVKKPAVRVAVRVVWAEAGVSLVEWTADHHLKRGYVKGSAVKDGKVSATTLKRAAPYGVAWEKIEMKATAEALAEALHRRGIWTADELSDNQQVALGTIQAMYRVDLAALNRAAMKGGTK